MTLFCILWMKQQNFKLQMFCQEYQLTRYGMHLCCDGALLILDFLTESSLTKENLLEIFFQFTVGFVMCTYCRPGYSQIILKVLEKVIINNSELHFEKFLWHIWTPQNKWDWWWRWRLWMTRFDTLWKEDIVPSALVVDEYLQIRAPAAGKMSQPYLAERE